MSETVEDVLTQLEAQGWSASRTHDALVFERGRTVITACQTYVWVEAGTFTTTSRLVNRYLPSAKQLSFLLGQIRRFADMDENGALEMMERCDSIKKTIDEFSSEQMMQCKLALRLFEEGINLLKTAEEDVESA